MWKRVFVMTGVVLLGACHDDSTIFVPVDGPAPPIGLDAVYYNRAVTVYWELATGWNEETFRIFGKRVGDASFFLIAEVTSCSAGSCEYTDTNIVANVSYDYFVSALDPDTGLETDSDRTVRVSVPSFAPPPVPTDLEVVALDATNYIRWGDDARSASDFAAYRVYLVSDQGATQILLGHSDSPGFLDALAENGVTSSYAVSSVDIYGHESATSGSAEGTPRPDFTGELVYSFMDEPNSSGFRFSESDQVDPIVSGGSLTRHFRLETDASGWWLIPGPSAEVFPEGVFTTELKCGVAADAQCQDWTTAPLSGYSAVEIAVEPEFTYMWRVFEGDGMARLGAIRVTLLGTDQSVA
ncbi:MAG: hypothetical protein IH921_12175, partial [Gemmatimonadetes bacterium]|nr:hypothetical protein [Gemmatimonadota bacterium]